MAGIYIHIPFCTTKCEFCMYYSFSNKDEILMQCSHLTQSIGVAMGKESLLDFARKAAINGVDRFPNIGSMTLYEVPWDGMFVMDRFIKWTKLNI